MKSLGHILANAQNDIEVLFDDVSAAADVLQPVGANAFTLKSASVQAGKPGLTLFDVPLNLSATASASASIAASSATFQPFDDDPLSAPANTSYAQLKVDGTFGLQGSVPSTGTTLQLSGSAATSASFSYLHLLPVSQAATRLSAFEKLVTTAQLPELVSFNNLTQGEIDRLTATLGIDLGIKATAGASFDTNSVVSLFDGLSGAVKANVGYSLEAALGWSLHEEMTLTVGRAQQRNANWVRVRLERSDKSSLTFGVTFGLKAAYDATDIVTVLQRALSLSPVMGAVKTLNEVLATFASGDWDKVKATISDFAANRLTAIAGPAWTTWVNNSQEVQDFIALANKIVNFYNGLDGKVQSLWTDVLTRLDAAPGSKFADAIAKIAALDPATDLQNLLSPQFQEALQIIEALTGKSIEELVLGSSTAATDALTKAKKLAGQIQGLITGAPADIDAAIKKVADQFGISKAVAFLAANATSTTALNDAANRWARDLVTRLVGKAFDQITTADLQKVQEFAAKLQAKVLGAEAAINSAMQKALDLAKGEFGFSVAFEVSRVTERSALLDFEFNPANNGVLTRVSSTLPSGDVQRLLQKLDQVFDPKTPVFDIRESVVSSRHVRSGAITAILSAFGLQNLTSFQGMRFDTSRVVTSNAGREAEYTGGYTLRVKKDGDTECSTWIESSATGPGQDPFAPYTTVDHLLRISFGRTDEQLSQRELVAYDRLLTELGFPITPADQPSVLVPINSDSHLAISMSLGKPAIDALIADLKDHGTGIDIRNAAFRVVTDGIVSTPLFAPPRELGDSLGRIILSKEFNDHWEDSSGQGFILAGTGQQIGGENVVVGGQVVPPYVPVLMVIQKRPDTIQSVKTFAQTFPAAGMTPAGLERLARQTANSFAATTSKGEFDNPSFNLWFVLARLSRLNANVLTGARGLAILRWKAVGATDFTTKSWQLTPNGIPTDLMAGRAFPLPANA